VNPYYQSNGISLYHGDARAMAPEVVQPNTIDLIFTDPPYQKKYLGLYDWLALEAARALKPNGFLIVYSGIFWKQQIMETLGKRLDFFYDFVLIHRGNTTILWPRRVITGYKSLLCYRLKGSKAVPRTNVLGKYNGLGDDKRFHKWGQDANTARYYIDCFTHEEDLVIDYFLGAGTFAEVCKALNRNFIGFEIDGDTLNTARDRLNGALGPKEKGRQQLLEF
jgi:site-specific DNA-methyltransferase (adenine-specific)